LLLAPVGPEVNVTAGGVVSIVKVWGALVPMLLAASVCCACAVYVPSARVEAVVVQEPSDCTLAVSDCTGLPVAALPAKTFTVTFESADAASALPLTVGVASFAELPAAGFATVTVGGVVSTVKVRFALEPVLPALSDCSARTV
jgi:hypothetical protein